MTAGQLREHYAKVIGEETRSHHKTYLIRRIIWRLQAKAEGDLSVRARRRAELLADDAEIRLTPPKDSPVAGQAGATVVLDVPASHDLRLPTTGMSIRRQYKGRTIVVNVLSDGFEFKGEHYKSLSAVAKAITGSWRNLHAVDRRAIVASWPDQVAGPIPRRSLRSRPDLGGW